MTDSDLAATARVIEPRSVAWYLEVPRSQVVLLQAYFELYDGVATVRTLQGDAPIVCVLTTPEQKNDCMGVLEAISEEVQWRVWRGPIPEEPL
jgi:hypothetical protein